MEFSIEQKISNFIENQFPDFYKSDGENFVLFLKAYYEWLESSGNAIYHSRNLLNYRDVDNTIESFLEYFQKKYLYGIPFDIIANKRFLLKHILDVYRSKGTIQCYKLLFRLIYNEDVEVYLPGRDILRASDGKWREPKYLEVSNSTDLFGLKGKTIVGSSSGTTAIVENVVTENYNTSVVNIVYISNVLPRGGQFIVGEKLLEFGVEYTSQQVTNSPNILGSLDRIEIINGGQGFEVGDIIKVADRNVDTLEIASYGKGGLLRISSVESKTGVMLFNLVDGGFGYTQDSNIFIYKKNDDGTGANFEIGSYSNITELTYNTDIISDFANLSINAASYGFVLDPTANASSNVGTAFTYANDFFGSILSLDNIRSGNNYTTSLDVFVRSNQTSNLPLVGNVSFNTGSNTVTGTNTIFTDIFANDDVVALRADESANTTEYVVIKTVVSNTELTLYGPPTSNSTANASYRPAPTILPSQFATYEAIMFTEDGSIVGENEEITGIPSVGNNIVSEAIAVDSGRGYVESEIINAYKYNSIAEILIQNGGVNYANNETVIISGGRPGAIASGYVSTDSNGMITSIFLSSKGSGYNTLPNVRIKTTNGSGAILEPVLENINTSFEVTGKVQITSIGRSKGFWETTDSFLNSNKYIQDSYYYQDYSYELRVARTLDEYKNIILDTFHTSGAELFGKYLKFLQDSYTPTEESLTVYNLVDYFTEFTVFGRSTNTNITVSNNILFNKFQVFGRNINTNITVSNTNFYIYSRTQIIEIEIS